MLERGMVVAAGMGTVDVSIEPSASCETCGACALGASGQRVLEGVVDEFGAAVGDTVEIETSARARRRAQTLVYVVPVVALVIGYLAGFLLGSWTGIAPDAVGAVLALAAGALALLALRRTERGAGHPHEQPRVRAIIARCRDCSPDQTASPSG